MRDPELWYDNGTVKVMRNVYLDLFIVVQIEDLVSEHYEM